MTEQEENVSFLGMLALQSNEVIERIFSNLVNWNDFKKFYDQLAVDPLSVQYLTQLTKAITELDFTNGTSIREPWTHPEEPWIHPKYPFPPNQILNPDRQVPRIELRELKKISKFLFKSLPDPSSLSISEEPTDVQNTPNTPANSDISVAQHPKFLPRLAQYRIAINPKLVNREEIYQFIADSRARFLNVYDDRNEMYFDDGLSEIVAGLKERVKSWGSKFIFAIPSFYYIEGTLYLSFMMLESLLSYATRHGRELRELPINKLVIVNRATSVTKHHTSRLRGLFNEQIPVLILQGRHSNNIPGIDVPAGTKTIYVLIKVPELGTLNPNLFIDGSKTVTEVIVNPSRALTMNLKALLKRRFPNAVQKAYQIPAEPIYE